MTKRLVLPAGLAFLVLVIVLAAQAPGGVAEAGITDSQTCLTCHNTGKQLTSAQGRTLQGIDTEGYQASVHGKFPCVACHQNRAEVPHRAAGPTDRQQIMQSCGQCHREAGRQYEKGVHGAAVTATALSGAATCASCHSAHAIQPVESAAFQRRTNIACANCHADRFETYLNSYHGKAAYLGRADVAGCTDCHRSHEVLPGTNPASSVSEANLVETCRQCHAGANGNFARIAMHPRHNDPKQYPILFWTNKGFEIFTFSVIGFLVLHVLLHFGRTLVEKRVKEAEKVPGFVTRVGNSKEPGSPD